MSITKTKLKKLWNKKRMIVILLVIIPLLGIFGTMYMLDYFEKTIAQQEIEPDHRPIVIETLKKEPVEDGVILKKFTHGNTSFTYMVGVENGVEETPSPDVLRLMKSSYSEAEILEQQKIIQEAVRNGPQGMGKVIGIKNPDGSDIYVDVNKAWKNTLIHTNDKLKKQYIDTNFACENYHTLAKKFAGESMYGVGYAGSVENYIYTKALDECISPKHQEELDKVYSELEEVNKTNDG